MHIYNTIQTNGILLDDEWGQFFRENNFLVGIPIDGPKEFHDAYRKGKKGNSTFDRVMQSIRLMQEFRVEFNILSTVKRINADYPLEVSRFFKDIGAQFIQFIPIVELGSEDSDGNIKVSDESVLPEQYGDFLIAVFDEWVKKDVGKIYIQIFDAALASWFDYPPSVCLFAPTCGTAMIIEHNGDLYCCDHFVDSEHVLGNIMETPSTTPRARTGSIPPAGVDTPRCCPSLPIARRSWRVAWGCGMQRNLEEVGIRPLLTDVADIEEAVRALAEGRLAVRPDLAH